MLRTVLYLRFSSDNQREEPIESQRRECRFDGPLHEGELPVVVNFCV